MRNIILFSFLFTFVGCASQKTLEPKQLEAGLDQTMQICDERIAKARQDLADTKARLQSLPHNAVTGAMQTDLNKRVSDLEQTLDKTKPERARMLNAKSEVASLIYSRSLFKNDDPATPKVEAHVREFYAASDALQKTVSDYSMKSSDLDEYLHAEKLYRTFHPAEFQTQVKSRIESAQEEARQMEADLNAARANAEQNRAPSSTALSEMQDFAQRYIDRANRLSTLSREMSFATADAKQISNLDSGWEKSQKLRDDFTALSGELDKISSSFAAAKSRL